VSVPRGVDDATACKAAELRGCITERAAAISHEAARVHSSHAGTSLHVLHTPGGRARLPVALSVRDDRLQLLLLDVPRPHEPSPPRSASISHTHGP